MPSIKLNADTLAILGGLRARFACGHSYDKIVQELVRRQIDGTNSGIIATDRLQRVEEMVTKILMCLEDKAVAPAQQKFKVQ